MPGKRRTPEEAGLVATVMVTLQQRGTMPMQTGCSQRQEQSVTQRKGHAFTQ